jgi:hypothetical protein
MKIVDIGLAGFSTPSSATMLHAAAQRWRREMVRLFDPYRPECHYMRGPGPKWHAKYQASRLSREL